MVEKNEAAVTDEHAGELRGTLIRRLVVAGVLVAVLLGILAFFDYLATPPEEPEMPVFTQAVPVAPRKEVSQPVTAAEEPAPVAAPASAQDSPPPPVVEAAPAAPAEVAPVPAAPTDAAVTRRGVPPSTPPAAAPRPAPAPAQAARPAAPPAPAVAEETAPPEPRLANTRVVPPAPAPAAQAPRLFSGFLLQAGVFSSVQRAEELHAKLTLSGVPSTLETRVQVGPFRTRQEAEAAQAKLKELGVQTILVAPASRR